MDISDSDTGPKKTITWDMANSTGDKGNFK